MRSTANIAHFFEKNKKAIWRLHMKNDYHAKPLIFTQLVHLYHRFTPLPRQRLWVRKEGEDNTSPVFVQYVTYPPNPLSVKGACRCAPIKEFSEISEFSEFSVFSVFSLNSLNSLNSLIWRPPLAQSKIIF